MYDAKSSFSILLTLLACAFWPIMQPTLAAVTLRPLTPAVSATASQMVNHKDNSSQYIALTTDNRKNNSRQYVAYLTSKVPVANEALFLHSPTTNDSKVHQKLLPLTSALLLRDNGLWHIKIYGEGVEHKFPPFLERILQRVQTYFSVYKHPDASRPLHRPVLVGAGSGSSTNVQTTTTAGSTTTTMVQTTITSTASDVDYTNSLEGSGGGAVPSVQLSQDSAIDDDEYTEFIAIGENDADDFIVVGED